MRAARLYEGPEVRVEEVPTPEVDVGEIRVAIQAAGVCGTDLHAARGHLPVPTVPVIMGHEGAGIVEAAGEGVEGFREGDRVLLLPSETCGACPACEAGHLGLCPGARILGMARDGTFAEKIAVPASCALPLPAEVPFEHGAILADAVATAYHAVATRAGIRGGERIAVVGCGGVGHHAILLARLLGAKTIVAADASEGALRRAEGAGADAVVDASAARAHRAIRRAAGGDGPEIVIEYAGRKASVELALAAVARGGRVVVGGVGMESAELGPLVSFVGREIGVLGSMGYTRDELERVIGLAASGRLDLSGSITGRYPLERAVEALDDLGSHRGDPVRLVLVPRSVLVSGAVPARAAVAHAPGVPLRIEEVTVREPGPGEVRVRVAACGICASDLHVWRTGEGIGFPAVLGHEAAGRIDAVGEAVGERVLGERVVIAWTLRCGRCRACRAGRVHVCAGITTNAQDGSLSLAGVQLGRYMNVSGLAERVVVPAGAAVSVPDGVPLGAACLVGCGVATGFGAAASTGATRWGEAAAVFGCGGVGLSAIQGARVAGAVRIVAVDPNRRRLELARQLGATDLVSPDDGDPVLAIHALVEGGVDVAVEAVGSGAVARQAFDALTPGGRAIVTGLTTFTEEIRIPVVSLLLDKSVRGSIYGSADPPRDFPRLFDLCARGQLQIEAMAGPDYPLEKVNDAFEALASGRAVRPRVFLENDR